MAAGAGADRDRFVDLLRGGSIVAVVVGHWLVADLTWGAGRLVQVSTLAEVPGMWPLTWLCVVIPLFFFVGGYANRRSWEGCLRRGEGYAAFLDRRAHRMLAPTWLYLAVVCTVGALVDRLGGLGIRAVGGLFLQPLWFLGAYLWIVAMAPLTLRAHHRWGWGVPLGLLLVVALSDLVRIGLGVSAAGYLNVLTIWLLMHQLGYHYRDGAIAHPAVMALGGLAATVLLVALPAYPATMVGVPGGEAGNMHPPTLAMATLGLAQIGLAVLARPALLRWLARPRVWRAVIAVNLGVVTLYLWHQPALAIAARLALPLGYPTPTPGSAAWWVTHVLWLAIPGAVLAGIVAVAGPAERVAPPPPAPAGPMTGRAAAVGALVVGLGMLALAGSSATEPFAAGAALGPFVASPVVGLATVAVGAGILRACRSGETPARVALALGAGAVAVVGLLWSTSALLVVAAVPGIASAIPAGRRSVPTR